MLWQRSAFERERNEGEGPGGLLLAGDALSIDLSPYRGKVQCVYLDPPYFTGERFQMKIRVGKEGWEKDKPYLTLPAYDDFSGEGREVYLQFLRRLVEEAHRLLSPEGSLFLHVDYRASAHARLICDEVFGEENFVNEIIWSYQTGGRSKKYFSRKHDNIFYYGKSSERYFDLENVPCGKKKERANHMKREVDERGRAFRTITSGGKTYTYYDDAPVYPDDVWADVGQMQQRDPQRTGYPTQKPQSLLERIILCSTRPGDIVADLMCGSGTAAAAAEKCGRRFLAVDNSARALAAARKRLHHTALETIAPFSDVSVLMDAGVLPGIGYYDVDLNAYTLPPSAFEGVEITPPGFSVRGLDAVDQWYAGLLNGGEFCVYASGVRTRREPTLPRTLKVPLLRGTVGILIIDVLGNRTFWTGASRLE